MRVALLHLLQSSVPVVGSIIKSAIFLLFLVFDSAVAQVKTFELGELRSDMLIKFGPPEKFFAPEPEIYLHGIQEYRSAARIWNRIDDVFMRESPTNAYEVHIFYLFDNRQSRLRPKQRAGRIRFIVDKPKNYRATLAELPEARTICKHGCSVYGLKEYYTYKILAYPINPSIDLLDLAEQVATGFEGDTARSWGIGIYLELENLSYGSSAPSWNSKISEIEISAVCLECELNRSRFDPKPTELGTWQPNP